jgi:hypothetical protein
MIVDLAPKTRSEPRPNCKNPRAAPTTGNHPDNSRLVFAEINQDTFASIRVLLPRWLPDKAIQGRERVAQNPNCVDNQHGSFKININAGKWSDFATADRSRDVVSLAAYLGGLSHAQAPRQLAASLGGRHGTE